MQLLFSNDVCSAFLLEIVKAFEANHQRHYLGRTAMQKLAYFSQAVGVPIPCSFEIYNFGPYSDAVTFAIESMLADDVIHDISRSKKYSNYRVASEAPSFSKDILSFIFPHRDKIKKVVKALGNFEPAKLELISTLHFICKKIESLGGNPTKDAVIDQFLAIKGDKFAHSEISSSYKSLKQAHLI